MRPNIRPRIDGLSEHLGCQIDHLGAIVVDGVGATSIPGVWAAGNAANPRAQVITAAGEGSAAAIAINADLVEEDVRNALRAARETSTL
jgi:thioredoxin reductase